MCHTPVQPDTAFPGSALPFAGGALWQATATGDRPGYAAQMLGPWVVSGIAVGLALPQLTAAATAALPAHQASTGSGAVSMARQLGMVVGTSIMVGLLGTGLPSLARSQHVWIFMAVSAAAAAIAPLVMGAVRGPAPEAATTPSQGVGADQPLPGARDPHDPQPTGRPAT
ncbi:hypothetical protein [Streptacidiphilus melanogenes]|uniref:hypothetical protein n=1 Tax=Streptacidiphilus melanogenes TaxID=411235 RepID=UPI0005A978C5|nr:hypothetical protein [Streptacidiphilus melanogenes]